MADITQKETFGHSKNLTQLFNKTLVSQKMLDIFPYCFSQEDFKTSVKDESGPVVVDFTASWCGPCKMIAPKYEAMAEEFKGIKFFKVDVDENEDVASSEGIQAMPTFIFYKNGAKVGEIKGANEASVRAELQKLSA